MTTQKRKRGVLYDTLKDILQDDDPPDFEVAWKELRARVSQIERGDEAPASVSFNLYSLICYSPNQYSWPLSL